MTDVTTENTPHDAVLVVSFGGPEGPDDVLPFLENVLRGRNVPRERMLEVSEHYSLFGGVSPINSQCRAVIAAIKQEFDAHQIDLPIYWGNRNWHPMLSDTMEQMTRDGVRRALAFVTSAYSSYSSCRQYRENILAAQEAVGDAAPVVEKLRVFYNHPDFVEANIDRLRDAVAELGNESGDAFHIAFTAHSIPDSMADGCDYVQQLMEVSRLSAESLGLKDDRWKLVYQSRSGPPHIPWLAPDICDHLERLKADGVNDVIVMPIGFLSDHMEVIFDLDHEARETSQRIGLNMIRSETVGTHPKFITMIRKLIAERLFDAGRESVGACPPRPDICAAGCCPAPAIHSRGPK